MLFLNVLILTLIFETFNIDNCNKFAWVSGLMLIRYYVHRLVASKTDGKMVQYECEGDTCQDEKIDALQLEVCVCVCVCYSAIIISFKQIFFLQYSYLLTSQLESQRIYWENKIVHLEKDTAEEVRTALCLRS